MLITWLEFWGKSEGTTPEESMDFPGLRAIFEAFDLLQPTRQIVSWVISLSGGTAARLAGRAIMSCPSGLVLP